MKIPTLPTRYPLLKADDGTFAKRHEEGESIGSNVYQGPVTYHVGLVTAMVAADALHVGWDVERSMWVEGLKGG